MLTQRLVRRICAKCAREAPTETVWEPALGEPAEVQTLVVGKGCDACNKTGYRGRIGLFELLQVDKDIRDALRDRPDARAIRALAIEKIEKGMRSLQRDGVRQAVAGSRRRERWSVPHSPDSADSLDGGHHSAVYSPDGTATPYALSKIGVGIDFSEDDPFSGLNSA